MTTDKPEDLGSQIDWIADYGVTLEPLGEGRSTRALTAGTILDIGGGGEGVISRLAAGRPVVAVDRSLDELKETPRRLRKVVMEGRSLAFAGETFPAATAFFTLLYMSMSEVQAVLSDVRRVLQDGGEFHIWDTTIPEQPESPHKFMAVHLSVKLQGGTIETGYGRPWPVKPRSLESYTSAATTAGFQIVESNDRSGLLFLRCRKG